MKRLKVRFHGHPEDIKCFMSWLKSREAVYSYQVIHVREISRVYKDRQSEFSRIYVDFDFDEEIAVAEIDYSINHEVDSIERKFNEILEK